jgi:hypothetical protein
MAVLVLKQRLETGGVPPDNAAVLSGDAVCPAFDQASPATPARHLTGA